MAALGHQQEGDEEGIWECCGWGSREYYRLGSFWNSVVGRGYDLGTAVVGTEVGMVRGASESGRD